MRGRMTDNSYAPVSVVIPCCRCSTTIDLAVGSIAKQSTMPAEVILVDDASGDGTLSILQRLAQLHPEWIKLVSLDKNLGAASARNAGWDAASQPYIAFLDADDAWHPEKLRIQYEYMCDNSDVVLSGHQCVWLREGEAWPALPASLVVTRLRPLSLIFKSCFSTPTVMLKREIPFRFPAGRNYSEDLNLWQQIAFAGLSVVRRESPLACFYKAPYGEGGLSSHLWEMEKGELRNIVELHRAGKIHWLLYVVATAFSLAKYLKRLLRVRVGRVAE